MKVLNKKSTKVSLAAIASLGFAIPVSAQDNQNTDADSYTLPAGDDNTQHQTQEHQRVEVLNDVFVKVGKRNGLYWEPNEDGNIRIGAYYKKRRGAKDGEYYTGNPQALPRREYVIEARIRF